MCLIAIVPAGKTMPRDVALLASLENGDGWGIMWRDESGNMRRVRSMIPWDVSKVAEDTLLHCEREGLAYAIHWRWATQGAVDKQRAHPFKLRDGTLLMHNGCLDIESGDKDDSDTSAFCYALNALPDAWYDLPWCAELVRMASSGSRLAVWPASEATPMRFGWGWNECTDSGVWYSNTNWKRTPAKDAALTFAGYTRPYVVRDMRASMSLGKTDAGIVCEDCQTPGMGIGVCDVCGGWAGHYAG